MWPEYPTCHAADPHYVFVPEDEWANRTFGETCYRVCSYCGSLHPEDLIEVLGQGARLSGSDWKYGWPHKFYVVGGPVGHATWHNKHALDKGYSPEALTQLLAALSTSGITWLLKDGQVVYSAPFPGYQKSGQQEVALSNEEGV